jgi:hypothetical protein
MLLALLVAAGSGLGVTVNAPARLEMSLLPTESQSCSGVIEPTGWRDPSSAWFFATGPTARLDEQELAAGVISSLLDLRMVSGALHLFVFGSPLGTGVRLTRSGWRAARWPFC